MNINDFVENRGKQGKSVAIARFWMGYKIYHASLGPTLMAASVVRGITLMPLNIVLSNERIYMM